MSMRHLRKSYLEGSLERHDLNPDPIEQFEIWLQEAIQAELIEPTAMTLATADGTGGVSARMVLLKEVNPEGFTFYTNYRSRKAEDLNRNPRAALVFYWDALERQVRIEGRVHKLPREESEAYFHSRPYGSQLGAWASRQSSIIASREVIEQRMAELRDRYPEGAVPLPEFWGGYLVIPQAIEFWQGRPDRLHDRFLYRRKQGDGEDIWQLERLSP